ncbi:MAG: extracellular solute-binding protein [Anaerolineae bacterium]|nr:extracellular solute-binding protein [Anaerolineae bacterium]
MMNQLDLSLTYEFPEPLQKALQLFTEETQIQVNVQVLDHEQRNQLSDFALHKTGPDVSEIGNTWLGNLAAMNALRPFSLADIRAMDGPSAFLSGDWAAGHHGGQQFAIPWRSDTRVIYYRRDLLAQAGIAEDTAFSSIPHIQQALARLQTLETISPLALNTAKNPMIIHLVAPWVWQAGGDFMSSDGRRTLFCEPQALAGLRAFYETFAPAIRPEVQNLNDSDATVSYMQAKTAVIITGHWMLNLLPRSDTLPEIQQNTGIALTPGVPYNGVMALIIWNHSRKDREALKLVQFLTRPDIQTTFVQEAGYLPVLQEAYGRPPFSTDPGYQIIRQSLETGRHLNAIYMWGLVEDQLTVVLNGIWQTIFADPEMDIAAAIEARLKPVAARLDRILSPAS